MSITGIFERPVLRQSQEGCAISGAIGDRDRGQRVVYLIPRMSFTNQARLSRSSAKSWTIDDERRGLSAPAAEKVVHPPVNI